MFSFIKNIEVEAIILRDHVAFIYCGKSRYTNSVLLRYDGASVGTDSDVSAERNAIIFKDRKA